MATRSRRDNRRLIRLDIDTAGGRIIRITARIFLVKSPDLKEQNRVSWESGKWGCDCGDYRKSGRPCMHVHAVDFLLRLPEVVLANQRALQKECPHCGSNDVISKGPRYNKTGSIPVKLCRACGKKFSGNTATGIAKAALAITSIDLYYRGLSIRDIRDHLLQVYGVERAASTIHVWVVKVTKVLVQVAERIKLSAKAQAWHSDEMKIRISGQWRWLWNVMDHDTRTLIVSMVTEGRSEEEALSVLKTAIARAGVAPKKLFTDGLQSYAVAVKNSKAKIRHIRNVKFKDSSNNNIIESFHSQVRAWTKVKRGMKGHTQDFMEGRRLFFNNLRPNSALNGKSPSGRLPASWIDLIGAAQKGSIHRQSRHSNGLRNRALSGGARLKRVPLEPD